MFVTLWHFFEFNVFAFLFGFFLGVIARWRINRK